MGTRSVRTTTSLNCFDPLGGESLVSDEELLILPIIRVSSIHLHTRLTPGVCQN